MSKHGSNPFKVTAYPSFRLYTAPKTFVEFKEKELSEKSMRKWLVDQHVEGFTVWEDPKKKVVAAPIGPEPAPMAPASEKERTRIGKDILKG